MAKRFLDSLEETQLKEISFKIFSPEEIRNRSVVEINLPYTYDQSGVPIQHGVMDSRLGVIQPGQTCQTCNGDYISCSGHIGHIELADPVIHIEYVDAILKVLNNVCTNCSSLLIENKCPNCEYVQIPIVVEKPNIFILKLKDKTEILTPYRIRNILEKCTDFDLNKLKINVRLEWVVLTVLPVPSVKTRPSIFLENGKKSEDDLTHKLIDIVKISEKLKKLKENVLITAIYNNLYDLLNYHIVTYFNNTISGIPPAVSRNSKPVKSLVERVKGKAGRFRHNLAGKRINYVARSVITPAPNIPINYIVLPIFFAKQLTKPVNVNIYNIEELRKLILSYPEYPSVLYVTNLFNTRLKVLELNKELLAEQLKPGYKVERQLIDNDFVLVNRQPSLHKLSIQAHKIIVKDQKTIGLHPCVCAPYNADFDGDEMNIHVPQDPISETEAALLMRVDENILAPKNGKPAIGAIGDVLSGAYLLSTNKEFSKSEVTYITKDLVLNKTPISLSGRHIISLLFENDFDFYEKSRNNEVLIEKGIFIKGELDKSLIGVNGSLYDRYAKRYGQVKATELLNNLSKLTLNLLRLNGLTYSYIDNQLDFDSKFKIEQLFKQRAERLVNADKQTTQKILSELRDETGKITISEKENPVILMAKAGSAGSQLNYIQVTSNVGLQSFSEKRNINAYGKNRTHSLELNDLLEKNSYIKSSYADGLNSYEFFEQACAARDSEIDVYIKTSTSGYLQRKLINCLNDVFINHDNSVTDSYGKIIQYKCGSDNLDFRKLDKVNPIIDLDLLKIVKPTKIIKLEVTKFEKVEFIKNLSKKLQELPFVFLEGISNYCIKYGINIEEINNLQSKIFEIYSNYNYDSFEPIGIVAAQSIGEPATQMTLKSKHVSGIAELKLTSGLERIIELLSASKIIKTPSMTFILKDITKKADCLNKIVMSTISNLYDIFVDLDKYGLILKPKSKEINLTDAYILIKNKISGIKLINVDDTILINTKSQTYAELNKVYHNISNLKVSGISKLENMVVTKVGNMYRIVTQGSNLKEAKLVFDQYTDLQFESNDIREIFEIYGLETARFYLVKEIAILMKKQGLDVSLTHINLVADLMTLTGKILPMGRTGVMKYKQSTIAKAAFETAISFIIDASLKSEKDKLQGVFENSILGKNVNVGTERIKLNYE